MKLRLATCVLATIALVLVPLASASAAARSPIPMLAYYYIWFNPASWNRAKTDYPILGRYSSDERRIIRRHIRWAKASGLTGFIVSWKSTAVLNDRLAKLIQVAAEEEFKLAIIYQGLDFFRDPLPVPRVADDLRLFERRYGSETPFELFEKPLVILSGTWKFSVADIETIRSAAGPNVLFLASERNLAGYERLSALVDGNAYYWSSVNPATFPRYEEKLSELAHAIHQRGGLWIAPAAPGFDARMIGGTSVVPRLDGQTLRTQVGVALRSSPDAIGLISWNEFSENSHVEPSEAFGGRYLKVLSSINSTEAPDVSLFDSESPAATGANYGIPLIAAAACILVLGAATARARARRRASDVSAENESSGET